MDFENDIFKKYKPDFVKLGKFGFVKNKDKYVLEELFQDNKFKAIVEVSAAGIVKGKVYDIESEDELISLRTEAMQGEFIGRIREDYKKILEEIRKKCFYKQNFIFEQSNRITDLIIEKYGAEPEFLWEQYSGSGIFRNSETQKWFGIIMDVDRSKIEKNKKGLVEVLNVKLPPEEVIEITSKPHFYEAYHINKKYWISIILDNSVSDKKIMELIETSCQLSFPAKKSRS